MRDDHYCQGIYPRAVRAEKDFSMLESGDRILVGLSGGADSLALLAVLAYQHKRIGRTLGFSLIPGHVASRYRSKPVSETKKLAGICAQLGLELRLSAARLSDDVFRDCFRCSQARRKALFDLAEEHGCNKIALGHHADDLVETFLLNIFYSGRLAALSPRQSVLRGKLTIIRPLCYVWKKDIVGYAAEKFGRIPRFRCPGSWDNQRLAVRRMLERLSKSNPHLKGNLLKAMANPRLEYLPVPSRRL